MAHLVSEETFGMKFDTDEYVDGNVIENQVVANKSSHLEEEKFICGICERSFNRKDTLKRHSVYSRSLQCGS